MLILIKKITIIIKHVNIINCLGCIFIFFNIKAKIQSQLEKLYKTTLQHKLTKKQKRKYLIP